jgi:hypothetical protein
MVIWLVSIASGAGYSPVARGAGAEGDDFALKL